MAHARGANPNLQAERRVGGRQVNSAVLHLGPAELAILQSFGDEHHSGAIPEHQLDAIHALGAEHVYGARERIGSHGVAHEGREAVRPFRKSTGLVATRTRTVPVGPIIAGS